MAEETEHSRQWIIYLLLVALIALTVAAAFLLFPPGKNGDVFYLALGMAIVAEAQVFLLPMWSRHYTSERAKPWRAAQAAVSLLYLLMVLWLTTLAGSQIAFNTLLVWHLFALFGLVAGIGLTSVAAAHTQNARSAYTSRVAWFATWKEQFEGQCDRIGRIEAADAGLKQSFAILRSDLLYADRESLPGVQAVERELDEALADIAQQIAALAQGETAAAEVAERLEGLRILLNRRSEKLRALRAA